MGAAEAGGGRAAAALQLREACGEQPGSAAEFSGKTAGAGGGRSGNAKLPARWAARFPAATVASSAP